jgi:hypothetical protein
MTRLRTSPELSACIACKSQVSKTVAAFCLRVSHSIWVIYRLSRLSGSRIGPRGAGRPGFPDCPSSRRDGGARGNDMFGFTDRRGFHGINSTYNTAPDLTKLCHCRNKR